MRILRYIGYRRLLFLSVMLFLSPVLRQTAFADSFELLNRTGIVDEVRTEGLKLIEKGLVLSTIETGIGAELSPNTIARDIKALYELGYFQSISVGLESEDSDKTAVVFRFVEKPRISEIRLEGNRKIGEKKLKELLKVFPNNMVDISKIKSDVLALTNEYHKEGYLRTQVTHELVKTGPDTLELVYRIKETPKVYLTEINFTGTRFFLPIDLERRLQSAEIDCFAWFSSSGVFQKDKVNIDLQIILQAYLQNGFIKVKIEKPKVVLIRNRDYSRVVIDIHIEEGEQYYMGDFTFESKDDNELLFSKEEATETFSLKTGEIYNPYKRNRDKFFLNDIYSAQGYAFAEIRAVEKIDEKSRTVDVLYGVKRGEKAYIGRVDILGNYDTRDDVIRRELEIFDNELFNGIKIRESKKNIARLGFFQPNTGIVFTKAPGENEQTLNYDIRVQESLTGSFNGAISYADNTGGIFTFSVAQKNLFGTGKSAKISIEYRETGENRYSFSLTTPYWFDTLFTNSFSIYSQYHPDDDYDTRTRGTTFGLSYPVWKDWQVSSRYSWKEERYEDINETGEDLLEGREFNTYRSLLTGISYSTVDNPMFPSNGFETSLFAEQYGGFLGGSTEYREYTFRLRYFKSLNENKTVVFATKYNQGLLQKTSSDDEIPNNKRYRLGGITTVHGFNWRAIEGPSSHVDITELYPYQGDYANCETTTLPDGTKCTDLPTERPEPRVYFNQHTGGVEKKLINLELLFPLTREGQNLRGVVFFDAGNVWAEDRMYEITGKSKNEWDLRRSTGLGIRIITPMGVLRFEWGMKLDQKEEESPTKMDFTISGLF